ncbi:hypothetical protein NGUA11_04186 [Salmonella enterica]|nr:hypothetical protein NGUA11_04186 [Salmonella enterica]
MRDGTLVNTELCQAFIHFGFERLRHLELDKFAFVDQRILHLLCHCLIAVVILAGGLFRQAVRQLLYRIGVFRQETIRNSVVIQIHIRTNTVHVTDDGEDRACFLLGSGPVLLLNGGHSIVGFRCRLGLFAQFLISRQLLIGKWRILLAFIQFRDLYCVLHVFRCLQRRPTVENAAQRIEVFKAHQRHFFFDFAADFLDRLQARFAEEFHKVIWPEDAHFLPKLFWQDVRQHVVGVNRSVNYRCSRQHRRPAPAILLHQIGIFDRHVASRLRYSTGRKISQLGGLQAIFVAVAVVMTLVGDHAVKAHIFEIRVFLGLLGAGI